MNILKLEVLEFLDDNKVKVKIHFNNTYISVVRLVRKDISDRKYILLNNKEYFI